VVLAGVLAENTERIEFGPLVSPVSFRHPVITAWQASAVDALAGGRLQLGIGAGWQEREHDAFGFDLLDTDGRFARFEEGPEVTTRLLRNEAPVSFDGEFYRLRDALLMPRSPRPEGPPVVIGGNGPRRTLPLVARFADEWNAVMVTPERFAELNARLDRMLEEAGRSPGEVRRTLMTRVVFGRTAADVDRKLGGVGRPGMAFLDAGDQFLAISEGRTQEPDEHRHVGVVVDDRRAVRRALRELEVEILPGRGLDFLDPWGNRWQVVEYSGVQFTKAPEVLRGMGLERLRKSEDALEELRRKGMAPEEG